MVSDAIASINDCLGLDGLHSNHFKLLGNEAFMYLSNLFNSFLNHNFITIDMLKGEIRPIIKDKMGNLKDSNNYRPVMISSNILKIFEYCIMDHLTLSLPLNNRQFGFRRNTSTVMAVAALNETISSYVKKNSKVYSVFLDLSKAFDRVNHNILLNKLSKSRVSPIIVHILKVMYENQFVHTSFNGYISNEWRLKNGVRQGAIISPVLFNFYINDILNEVACLDIGCNLAYNKHNTQAYADDITALAPSAKGLQLLIDKIANNIEKLNLKINEIKTVCMIFSQKTVKDPPEFFLNNVRLAIVDKYKYLGVVLTNKGVWKEDIRRCELSFLRQFYSIFRKFYFVDRNVFKFLFKTYCLSLYGCELWSNLSGSVDEFDSFSVNYHLCIKNFMNTSIIHSNHDICEEAGLLTFKHLTKLKLITFVFNLFESRSVCFAPFKFYFLFYSHFINNVNNEIARLYNISNILDNDKDAILSRINFVQAREKRSTYYLT